MAPELSVVIAVYNGAATLPAMLSALDGGHGDVSYELVLADNGSSDGSRAAASSVGVPFRWIDVPRRGQSHARNAGAAAAAAPNLVFLDQDDVPGDGYLDAMAKALASQPFVAARLDVQLLNPPDVAASRAPAHGDALADDLLPWAYGCTLGVRKEAFQAVGGFRDFAGAGEDQDLCWRLQLAGYPLEIVPDAVLHYRFRADGRGAYRQGFSYGRSGVGVARAHRALGASPPGLAKIVKGLAVSALLALRPRTRLAGLFQLGKSVGGLVGTIRDADVSHNRSR